MRRREGIRELLDGAGGTSADVAENLRQMERFGRRLGVWRELRRFLGTVRLPGDRPVTCLDVATGSGWVPRALAGASGELGARFQVVGLDASAPVVWLAREWSRGTPSVEYVVQDARHLRLPPGSYDVVVCTQSLHHFSRPEAVALLRRFDETAGAAWFVCDLLRSRTLYWLAWLATRLTSRNRLTRHDGPASVLRAFTLRELRELAADAGVSGARVERFSGVCGAVSLVK